MARSSTTSPAFWGNREGSDCFLVALATDYNNFLMTRVREESTVHGTAEGVGRGLVSTGGVITSAGIVLAATFAALLVIPIHFLVQLAVIISLGVLIDTFLVRSLLVPALTHLLGDRIWWPGGLVARAHRAGRGGTRQATSVNQASGARWCRTSTVDIRPLRPPRLTFPTTPRLTFPTSSYP